MTDPAVGASTWASGSQVCSGTIGTLTAKPATNSQKTSARSDGSSTPASSPDIRNVPVLKPTIRRPMSISALPANVYTKNFMAA